MTIEEIKNLGIEELETRAAEIDTEAKTAEPDAFEILTAELDAIEERKKVLAIEAEERKKAAEAVIEGAGKPVEVRKENEKMTNKEVRNSKEYIEAFAKYVKTGKDLECRGLLTENADGEMSGGRVPTPEFVENIIRAAWDNAKVWPRFRKSYVRGNLKVGFELSATDAQIHEEGGGAITEEELELGIVELIPKMIKKWITISDEVMGLASEDFLRYVYDEFAYKIIQKAENHALTEIISALTAGDQHHVGVPEVTGPVSATTIIQAMALLGDQAQDLVFVANGATIAAVRVAALSAGYAYDPFQGMTVIKKELKDGQDAAWNGAIIGDLAAIQANLPEGEAVRFKFDDLSLAEEDMVKVVGRLYAGIGLVQPGMIVRITPGN